MRLIWGESGTTHGLKHRALSACASIDENASLSNAYRESPPTASADSDRRDKKSTPTKPGAVPKRRTESDAPSTAGAAATPKPSKAQTTISTPPPFPGLKLAASPTPSLAALQLQKETQELEVKKLELQLQLAQLQGRQMRPSKGGSDVTLSLIFLPTCRLYGLRQMMLSQIVAFLPSVSVGCRCSGTRLSLHFKQFCSDVACRQNPLEGLTNGLAEFHRVDTRQITRRLKSATEDPSPAALATHFRPR